MNILVEEIKKAFGGRLVGNKYMKEMVCLAVSKLPNQVAHQIINHCWFFSSTEDAWGYAFNGDDLKGKHLIFLSDILFHESEEQILYTILHEIGHIHLGHKNSITYQQSKEEITRQESAANQFAKKHLSRI